MLLFAPGRAHSAIHQPLDPLSKLGMAIALTLAALPFLSHGASAMAKAIFVVTLLYRAAGVIARFRPLAAWFLALPVLILLPPAALEYGHNPSELSRLTAVAYLAIASGVLLILHTRRDAGIAMALATPLLLVTLQRSQNLDSMLYAAGVQILFFVVLALAWRRSGVQRSRQDLGRATAWVLGMLLLVSPLIVATFLLFPRMPVGLFGGGGDGDGHEGMADTLNPSEIDTQRLSSKPAFRVTFPGTRNDRPQRPEGLYWRTVVLEAFDGSRWRDVAGEGAATESVTLESEPFEYVLDLEPQRGLFLPILDGTSGRIMVHSGSGPAGLVLREHGALMLTKPMPEALRVRSTGGEQFRRWSSAADVDRNLLLPPERNPRALSLGQQLAAQGLSAEAIAQHLLERFHGAPYRYTLSPGRLGRDWIDEFLFDSKAGFCEHYAAAFAFVMRAAGIPSRVVGGYFGGTAGGNWLTVRQSDAHAWAEYWIPGRGWVRSDPTAAVHPSRVEKAGEAATEAEGWGTAWRRFFASLNQRWADSVLEYDMSAQLKLLPTARMRPSRLLLVVLGSLLVLGLGTRWGLRAWQRWSAWRALPPRQRSLIKVERQLSKAGLARNAGETPRQWLDRARRSLSAQHGRDLAAIVACYENVAYGCLSPDDERRALALLDRLARNFQIPPSPPRAATLGRA
jgi:hypothetical protein